MNYEGARKIIAFALFLLPGMGAIALDKDFYPFLNYRMFSSSIMNQPYEVIRVEGENTDGTRVPIVSFQDLFPLGRGSTLRNAFLRHRETGNLPAVAHDVAAYYLRQLNFRARAEGKAIFISVRILEQPMSFGSDSRLRANGSATVLAEAR